MDDRDDAGMRPSALAEQIPKQLQGGLTPQFADSGGEWNPFWADPDAVLRIAAITEPAIAHDGMQALLSMIAAGGMVVHQSDRCQGGGTDKLFFHAILRTGLHAATAAHAAAVEVALLPCLR